MLAFCLLLPLVAVQAADVSYTVTAEVFFDFEIKDYDGPGDDYRGRFVVGIFGDTVPMTALNFMSLAKGYSRNKEKPLTYKDTKVHRLVPDFLFQMGDITVGDGTGSVSIYGENFVDENFDISHGYPGIVSMANIGADSNGSQFFVLFNKARWMDGKHVAFGKIVRGWDDVILMNESGANSIGQPKREITILDCGTLPIDRKYSLTEKQMETSADI